MAGGIKSFLAFWLGRAGAIHVTPSTITDIRMGQLTMRSGLLSLRDESGSVTLRMNSGTVEFVTT